MVRPLVYLVDASIYIFRAYFAIPDKFHSRNGEAINAVYGYTNFLLDLLERKPNYISVAFDKSLVGCFRNEIYPAYKANRDLPDENLLFQLAKCEEVTQLLGIHNLSLERYEADDIIGTLHKKIALPKVIVTRDKDLGQLIGPEDTLWDFANGIRSSRSDIRKKIGIWPEQIPDYLALAGDPVDNIPGAPGIGAKTAAALLTEFGSLEEIYSSLNQVSTMELRGAKKIYHVLVEYQDQIMLYRRITGIVCDIPIEISLKDLQLTSLMIENIMGFFNEMSFPEKVFKRIEYLK
ncbi:MAG: flap endonuclease [Gammaproteobacteria bacterium]|nr:flap endonuclease [Gammaproteobacteria bacterium]